MPKYWKFILIGGIVFLSLFIWQLCSTYFEDESLFITDSLEAYTIVQSDRDSCRFMPTSHISAGKSIGILIEFNNKYGGVKEKLHEFNFPKKNDSSIKGTRGPAEKIKSFSVFVVQNEELRNITDQLSNYKSCIDETAGALSTDIDTKKPGKYYDYVRYYFDSIIQFQKAYNKMEIQGGHLNYQIFWIDNEVDIKSNSYLRIEIEYENGRSISARTPKINID